MYPMFILGSDISPFNVRSAMKVRVVRAYNVPERRGSNAIRSKEVVFHNKEGTLVHAHIPKQLVPKFINDFKEGLVWVVKNFLVITNFYTYRTTPHKYMIKFNYQTTVKQFKKIDFPSQMFRLTPFQALKVEGVDDKLLVDGEVKLCISYDVTQVVINQQSQEFLEFREK
nr:replication protein A 70 kDa DNA-binding subunit D-like [Ipomoea batatas]